MMMVFLQELYATKIMLQEIMGITAEHKNIFSLASGRPITRLISTEICVGSTDTLRILKKTSDHPFLRFTNDSISLKSMLDNIDKI